MGAEPKGNDQLLHRRRTLVTFAVVGATVACLLITLAMYLVYDLADPSQALPGISPYRASVSLWILDDGCTVERGDIMGESEARRLHWVVVDLDDTTVYEGMALEPRFRYSAAGSYRVFLKAWVEDAYYAISPTVSIRCP